MGRVEIRIVLDEIEPPGGRLRTVSDRTSGRAVRHVSGTAVRLASASRPGGGPFGLFLSGASDVGGDEFRKRAGPATRGPRSGAWWSGNRRARQLPACPGAGRPLQPPRAFVRGVSATVGIRVVPPPESTDLNSPRARRATRPGQDVAESQALGDRRSQRLRPERAAVVMSCRWGQIEVIQREANQLSL
jgi:hypothetical protein